MRVSVKVIRTYPRFIQEAHYRYALGQSPSIPSLLGGHWEDAQPRKKDDVGDIGYLVMQVINGTSLDKLVRDAKLTDTVSKICVLDRIVSALLFAQRVSPAITHQDLHPGNVLLVPPSPPSNESSLVRVRTSTSSTSTDRSPVTSDPKISKSLDEVPPRAAARVLVHTAKPARINRRTQRPHIPKSEDETLSVLERVALHNRLDEAVDAEAVLKKNHKPKSAPQGHHIPNRGVSPFTTSSITRTTLASVPSSDDPEKQASPTVTGSSISSFTVMLMDFPSKYEAEGKRRHVSWDQNKALAGYCAPERATSVMWQRIKQKMDMERERQQERERRLIARNMSNGRRSPRPPPRRRSSNGMGGFVSSRSSSSSHRRQFDAETYGLFGGDDLIDLPEPGDTSFGFSHEPSSPPDRSGRHAVARGPTAFRDFERARDLRELQKPRKQFSAERSHPFDETLVRASSMENILGDTVIPPKEKTSCSKIDVWSLGWLLYYMCTGRHPPPDAWARKNPLDTSDLRDVPKECREVIKMCVKNDVQKRACMRDVKRQIDSILQGLMFAKGLALIESDREAAFVLLDKAVGIKSSNVGRSEESAAGSAFGVLTLADMNGGDPGTTITNGEAKLLDEGRTDAGFDDDNYEGQGLGLNPQTRMGLASLPLLVVRRVEWEAAARYLERTPSEIKRLRAALVNEKWSKADVTAGTAAVDYLKRRSDEGVSSAQSALGWIYRWGAGGVDKDINKAMQEWEKAVQMGDPEGCNGLGLVYHYGREVEIDGEKALMYYQMAVDQGYPAAAVNLGVMLHEGCGGVAADGVAARGLYEMACRHGDAIAANNLGLLLQHGGRGVQADAAAAVRAYEMAIERNERHHACRNLGELLWDGADGVPRSRANAVEYFALAIARGDVSSRERAVKTLKVLVREGTNDGEEDMAEALVDRCKRLLCVR